jgi:hypothetical protein
MSWPCGDEGRETRLIRYGSPNFSTTAASMVVDDSGGCTIVYAGACVEVAVMRKRLSAAPPRTAVMMSKRAVANVLMGVGARYTDLPQ